MGPKRESSKRKHFFQPNFEQSSSHHETIVPPQYFEDEGPSETNLGISTKKLSKRSCFFEDQQNFRNEGMSSKPLEERSYNKNDVVDENVSVLAPAFLGQVSYQRTRQGVIVNYNDSGDNSYTSNYCGASFWSGEALKRRI